MKLFLSILFLSLSVSAQTFQGSVKGQEVEPIYEQEYVGHTCYRDEPVSCNCDENGCQTCSNSVSYECGGYEWVRRGSKHLFDLSIDYKIDFSQIGSGAGIVPASTNVVLDTGYKADTLLKALLKTQPGMIVLFEKPVMTSVESAPKAKQISVDVKAKFFDAKLMDTLLRNTQITNLKNIALDKTLPLADMNLEVCMYQERRFGYVMLELGCSVATAENMRVGKLELSWLNPRWVRKKKPVIYSFEWSIKGHSEKWETKIVK